MNGRTVIPEKKWRKELAALTAERYTLCEEYYFSGMLGKNVTNTYQLSRFDESITEQGGVSKEPQ